MADYNVNMKQWNGSSFDNVLPLSYNAKQLEGKSYNDIIQYSQNLVANTTKLVLIDSVVTTSKKQTIQIRPATVGMSNLCALMIVSYVDSLSSSISDVPQLLGKSSERVLFKTIDSMGGPNVSVTYLFSISGVDTGAYSAGVSYDRNNSSVIKSVLTERSGVQFNTIVNIDLVFNKADVGSTATVYGLMK